MDAKRSPSHLASIFGPLEIRVLEALWDRGTRRRAVSDLQPQFPGVAYTTLMTTLDRLFRKGTLSRDKHGRAFLYQPRATQDELISELAGSALATLLPGDTAAMRPILSMFVDTRRRSRSRAARRARSAGARAARRAERQGAAMSRPLLIVIGRTRELRRAQSRDLAVVAAVWRRAAASPASCRSRRARARLAVAARLPAAWVPPSSRSHRDCAGVRDLRARARVEDGRPGRRSCSPRWRCSSARRVGRGRVDRAGPHSRRPRALAAVGAVRSTSIRPAGVPAYAIDSPSPIVALVGVFSPKLIAART